MSAFFQQIKAAIDSDNFAKFISLLNEKKHGLGYDIFEYCVKKKFVKGILSILNYINNAEKDVEYTDSCRLLHQVLFLYYKKHEQFHIIMGQLREFILRELLIANEKLLERITYILSFHEDYKLKLNDNCEMISGQFIIDHITDTGSLEIIKGWRPEHRDINLASIPVVKEIIEKYLVNNPNDEELSKRYIDIDKYADSLDSAAYKLYMNRN